MLWLLLWVDERDGGFLRHGEVWIAVLVLVLGLRVIGKVRELTCGGAQHRRVAPGVNG